jgi:hypothetical protein
MAQELFLVKVFTACYKRRTCSMLEIDSEEYKVINEYDSKRTERLLKLGRISPLYTSVPFGRRGEYVSLLYFAVNQMWDDGIALCILYGGDPLAAGAHHDRPETARACAERYAHRGHNDDDDDGAYAQYMLALVGGRPVDAPLVAGQGMTALMYAADRGHAYVLQLLLQRYGADVRLRNPFLCNANALFYAMRRVESGLRHMLSYTYSARFRDAEELDPCLAILVGPLDPIEYQHQFRCTIHAIQRHAHASILRR